MRSLNSDPFSRFCRHAIVLIRPLIAVLIIRMPEIREIRELIAVHLIDARQKIFCDVKLHIDSFRRVQYDLGILRRFQFFDLLVGQDEKPRITARRGDKAAERDEMVFIVDQRIDRKSVV